MICSCKYGIADFSISRINVGFECGLLKAWGKPTAVLIYDRYKFYKIFSDYQGIDPIGHKYDRKKLITDLSDWIETNWQDGDKEVPRAVIFKVADAVIEAYQGSYSYDKINLFYHDIAKVFGALIEQAKKPPV